MSASQRPPAEENSQAARTQRRAAFRRSFVLSPEALAYEAGCVEELRNRVLDRTLT